MPYRYRGPNNAPQDFVVSFNRPVDLSAEGSVTDGRGATQNVTVVVQAGDEISDADWALWDMANQPCKRYWRRV